MVREQLGSHVQGGNDTKHVGFVIMVIAVLIVLFSGCISTPEKGTVNESQTKVSEPQAKASGVRYVQVNFLDGTAAGGRYVSETPGFTTIDLMYLINPVATKHIAYDIYVTDPDKYITRANGTVGFKNDLINTMIDIGDPEALIKAKQQELREKEAAAQKVADEKAEMYRKQKEEREATPRQG